jgi:hypothetical protein
MSSTATSSGPERYGRYAQSIVGGITNDKARGTTLRLAPRAAVANFDRQEQPS